jgi:hypothetical protein
MPRLSECEGSWPHIERVRRQREISGINPLKGVEVK